MDPTPTGYSAPTSADVSLNNSGTSSSSINVVYPPKKIARAAQAPAAPARIATMQNIAEHDNAMVVQDTSSSELLSIDSSRERDRRVALAKARRDTTRAKFALAQMQVELAEADQEVAESELDLHRAPSRASSIGRLADVQSDGGNSTHSRQRSSAGQSYPLTTLDRVPERAPTHPQEADSLPAKAGSETQGNTYLLQHNYNTVNAWQENHVAVEAVMQLAELRHQEVINSVTLATEQHASVKHRCSRGCPSGVHLLR